MLHITSNTGIVAHCIITFSEAGFCFSVIIQKQLLNAVEMHSATLCECYVSSGSFLLSPPQRVLTE